MAGTPTKGGTGYGAVLAISATPATLSVPAPYPATTPTKFTLISAGPILTTTLGFGGTSGWTSSTALPTTTSGSGTGATITTVAAAGVITSMTAVGLGTGYQVGDKVFITQVGGVGAAYATVASITGAAATGIPILQIKTPVIPAMKWNYDTITNLSSPTQGVGTVEEYLPTTLVPGTFTAEGIFLPSDPGLIAMQTACLGGLANKFQVQLGLLPGQSTSGNYYEFNGWVDEMPTASGIDVTKAITWKVSIKLSTITVGVTGS